MKRCLAALIALGVAVAPALAQSKLEQAIAKAEEQLQKGKPDDAVKTLTKAAGEAGAEGQMALGRLQERLGNLDAAAAAYQAAAGGGSAEALAALANFTLRRGKAADALATAKKAAAAAQSPEALAALARAQLRTGDAPGALQTADKAVAAGASAMAQVARAEALIGMGRNADAEAAARKAIELDPKSALAYSRLATALVRLNRVPDAVAAGKKGTELDEKLGEAYAAYGLALIAVDPQKNWSEAIAQAQQGAFLDPDNPHVQAAVGRIFEVNGQLEQAAAAFRRALTADPAYAPARLALIQAEINRGNRDAALEEAMKAEAGAPSPDLELLIGEHLARKGDWEKALGFLEKAIKGLPGNADAWALLGRAYHNARRYEDAADAYGKAVELAPTNADYRTTYGLILGQAGDLDKGLAQLLKVTSSPGYKDAAGWTNLGWVYRNMDKAPESIAAYQKALQLDPKQEQAALGLGWAYNYTKDYDKAIQAYEKAIQIDPKEAGPDANLGIGWAYVFKREPAKAKEYSAKAAAAGRKVDSLNTQIDRVEKAIASGQAMTEEQQRQAEEAQQQAEAANKALERANQLIGSKNPANRASGCKQVAALAGGGAINALVTLMQTDASYDVRIACTQALGTLGAAGRPAVRNVEAMMRLPPPATPITPTPAELENEMKDGDFKRALRDTLAKIK